MISSSICNNMEKPLAHPSQQKSVPSPLQKQLPKIVEQQRSLHIPSKPSNNVVSGSKVNENNEYRHNTNVKKPLWDCGSTLYDSFELNAFKKQLDSAIVSSSRTMSMPRLPSEDVPRATAPAPQKKSKLSRSFQKLLRTMFRAPKQETTKPNNDSNSSSSSDDDNLKNYLWLLDQPTNDKKVADNGSRYYVVYEKSSNNGLSTIPEVSEAALSPEVGSLVRKTMSERFTSRSIGISCA